MTRRTGGALHPAGSPRTGGPLKIDPRFKKKQKRTSNRKNRGRNVNRKQQPKGKDVSIRQSDAPYQVIYGRARVGGVYAYVFAEALNLHQVLIVCGHPFDSVEKLFLDDIEILWGHLPDVRWSTGGIRSDGSLTVRDDGTNIFDYNVFLAQFDGVNAQPDLVAIGVDNNFPVEMRWTTDHRMEGLGAVYLITIFTNEAFPDGLPDTEFIIKGKLCYDPRTDGTGWTANAALITADYLTDTTFGLAIPWDQIDTDALIEAADICDEAVPNLYGTTDPRYEIHMAFEASESHDDILDKMLTSMAGKLVRVGGKFKIYAGAYREPVLTLTREDYRGGINIRTRISRKDNFNAVKGKFVNPDKRWEISDFPPVKNDFYKAQDNGVQRFEDVTFPATISRSAAMRLAKILLEQQRQPIEVSAPFSLRAFQVEAGENVKITDDRYGWDEKVFYVMETELLHENGDNGAPVYSTDLLLRETAAAVWNWNNGEETGVDLSPNTNLPSPFSAQKPDNLTLSSGTNELYVRTDGTVFTRIRVQWDPLDDFFTTSGGHIEIQYKKSADTDWIQSASVSGDITSAFILDVQDGQYYDVRVRGANATGGFSAWEEVLNHLVIGKTEPPSDVEGFGGELLDFGVRLYWDAVPDRDVKEYEIRLADLSLLWQNASFVARVSGTQLRLEANETGSYRYLIKALDTSGNYSENATPLNMVLTAAPAPTITHTMSGVNVLLKWNDVQGVFATEQYEIRYGDSYVGSNFLTFVKGNTYNIKGQWTGIRRFWVTAIDIHGNYGTPGYRDVQITAAFAVINLTAQVIDNNVLLRWEAAPGGTLPIEKYRVYKGFPFDDAEVVGDVGGTFSAIFEIISGSYTYWVRVIDSAGNLGALTSVSAEVDEPPDFVLVTDIFLDPDDADTLANIYIERTPEPPEIIPEVPPAGTHMVGEWMGIFGPLTYSTGT